MKRTKTIIIKEVVKRTGLNQKKVELILNEYLLVLQSAILEREHFTWRNFGTFYLKDRKPKMVRDFSTGNGRNISLSPTPAFKPSKCLLKVVDTAPIATKGNVCDKVAGRANDNQHPSKSDILTFKTNKYHPKVETNDGKPTRGGNSKRNTRLDVSEIVDSYNCSIIISQANPEQRLDSCIGYIPKLALECKDRYPIVWMPKEKAILKLPRHGRSDIRGYKESDFLSILQSSDLCVEIDNDCHLPISGRLSPYEPDIVLFDKPLGLFIDVEIDEPYSGHSRLSTHTTESNDDVRNTFFKESGWVVVRFTEHQVHVDPFGCVEFIKGILCELRKEPAIPIKKLQIENRWNNNQAVLWERDLYREKYLGIQGFPKIIRHKKVLCTEEDNIEYTINRTHLHDVKYKNGFNPACSVGTKNIIFDEETHTYFPEDNPSGSADSISVTTLIEKFFPYFDQESYIKKKMAETGMSRESIEEELQQPSLRGTDMHKQFELFLKGQPHNEDSKEFQLFKNFYQQEILKRNLRFFDAEKSIILPEYNIAGTVDALFQKSNGDFIMVDWKRSTHLIIDGYPKKYGYGRGLSIINHLDNSSYYKYELQQSFYKYILEKEYGMKVSSMILAVIHPQYDKYFTIRLSNYREEEVLNMMEAIDIINN